MERCLDEATKPKVEMVIKTEMIAAYKQGIIEVQRCAIFLCGGPDNQFAAGWCSPSPRAVSLIFMGSPT